MSFVRVLGRLDGKMIEAILSWPKFSVTSFVMVSDLLRQGIMPKTVLDIGANVGQFAVASAKLFPGTCVHSFEPNPDCFTRLQKNVKGLRTVTVYPLALGEQEEEATFHVNSHSHSSSILALTENHRRAFPIANEVGTIQVKVSTLDKTFAGVELPSPILLKLDVQGFEAQVVRGGADTLKRVDHLILEASFKPMYQGEMLFLEMVSFVESFGFTFLRPIGLLSDPQSGEIVQMDALFCKVKTEAGT